MYVFEGLQSLFKMKRSLFLIKYLKKLVIVYYRLATVPKNNFKINRDIFSRLVFL